MSDDEDLVVSLPTNSSESTSLGRIRDVLGAIRLIWTELTAGFGLGFERMLMWLTGMQNIRDAENHRRVLEYLV